MRPVLFQLKPIRNVGDVGMYSQPEMLSC